MPFRDTPQNAMEAWEIKVGLKTRPPPSAGMRAMFKRAHAHEAVSRTFESKHIGAEIRELGFYKVQGGYAGVSGDGIYIEPVTQRRIAWENKSPSSRKVFTTLPRYYFVQVIMEMELLQADAVRWVAFYPCERAEDGGQFDVWEIERKYPVAGHVWDMLKRRMIAFQKYVESKTPPPESFIEECKEPIPLDEGYTIKKEGSRFVTTPVADS